MIGEQGEDSCGKSGSEEEAQGCPRKTKSCTEINSGVTSHSY
ncbi:hypothetical protein ABEY43_12050 [Priestia megaterium]|nr:hypothetical protein [Priestia megaterium]